MPNRALFDSDAWRLRFARLQDRAKRARSAEAVYRAILRRQPSQTAALTGLGRQLLRQRRYEEAAAVWEQVVAARPGAAGARFQLARSLHRMGRLADAGAQYLRAIELAPNHDKARVALATLAARLARSWPENGGDPDAAVRICRQLDDGTTQGEELRETVAAALVTLAGSARNAAPDRTLALFDKALALVPAFPGALRGAAFCHERLGHPREASALWDRLALVYPESVEVALHRDRIAAVLESEKAGAGLAIEATPGIQPKPSGPDDHARHAATAGALMQRLLGEARTALDRGEPRVALAFARRGFSLDEANLDALALLVRSLIASERWNEAVAPARSLAKTRPDEARAVANSLPTGGASDHRAWLLQAEIRAAAGEIQAASDVLRRLALATGAALTDLVAAARLADKIGLTEDGARLYERALSTSPSDHLALEVARFYTRADRVEDAILAWSRLIDATDMAVEVTDNICRLHATAGRPPAAIALVQERGARLFADVDGRPSREQNGIIRIVGRYLHCCLTTGDQTAIARLDDLVAEIGGAGPCAYCLRARLLDGLGRKADAEEQLRRATSCERQIPADVTMNLRSERCVHAIRYGLFGETADDYDAIAAAAADPADPYHPNFRAAASVLARYAKDRKTLYPEHLLDEILRRSDARPIGYAATKGKVMMVVGSLGQGGGEKQTVTVLRRFARRKEPDELCLAVRTVDRRPSDDFFLPTIESLGLRWTVYGDNWAKAHRSVDLLPELVEDEIASAIDLSPHSVREELLRVSRLILDERPDTVHIWQDMPIVAVACVLCGVPRYFIHRGSLSPDYWQFNDYQWHTHFRPMRLMYRRLADRPGFFFLNNCDVGCRTDANWIGATRDDRFRVLYNAVEFESLGADDGPNLALRRELG
ncbi:MAG: tetratricopeptide repeat protein, partial [Stellaceae bacterium]